MGTLFDTVQLADEQGDAPDPIWLGIITDNRRLFDALQDGWLRPLPPNSGSLLGVNGYLPEDDVNGNRILVGIPIDIAALPDLKVLAFRQNRWESMFLSRVTTWHTAVYWPGPLPLFSTKSLSVSTNEQRVRLLSIGKRISNVDLPAVSVDSNPTHTPSPRVPPPEVAAELVLPVRENSIRGAMSMALWFVPRIDPWLDVLTASLSSDHDDLAKLANAVDASWWRFPPWAQTPGDNPQSAQDCLWLAAVEILSAPERMRPSEATDRIANAALKTCSQADEHAVRDWRAASHRILRAETAIQHRDWRKHPVGLAIQLVLARPEPIVFKTWFSDDQVDLPPAVVWSGAALCGLFHGYRDLDTRFRGEPQQRELLAVHALRLCSGKRVAKWPNVSDDPPKWRRQSGNFFLSWSGREFACKHEQERGRWYAADFDIDSVHDEARAISKERGWRCLSRILTLEEGSRSILGSGTLEVRKETATEPGRLPPPPPPRQIVESDTTSHGVPGLHVVQNFLSESEEDDIVIQVDGNDWSNELPRRVQHYGWRYDYTSRKIAASMRIGPLPDWAITIAHRLVDSGCVQELPDQLIVNEYRGDQGISRHIDSTSSFADGVAMISLLEPWEMDFRRKNGREKVTLKLERRSATILTGDARYRWTHEIPKRKTEPGVIKPGNKKPSRVLRGRRISLTFRKVIADGDIRPAVPN